MCMLMVAESRQIRHSAFPYKLTFIKRRGYLRMTSVSELASLVEFLLRFKGEPGPAVSSHPLISKTIAWPKA